MDYANDACEGGGGGVKRLLFRSSDSSASLIAGGVYQWTNVAMAVR